MAKTKANAPRTPDLLVTRLEAGGQNWDAEKLEMLDAGPDVLHAVSLGSTFTVSLLEQPAIRVDLGGVLVTVERPERPVGTEIDPYFRGRARFAVYYGSGKVEVFAMEAGRNPDDAVELDAHRDTVESCRFSSAGGLATASQDGSVGYWNPETGEGVRMEGHEDWVVGVEFLSSDWLLSWSLDRTLRTWDPVSGRQLAASPRQDADLTAVAVDPSSGRSARFASGDRAGKIKTWRQEAGRLEEHVVLDARSPITGLQFVETGPGSFELVSGSEDGAIRLWDTAGNPGPGGGESVGSALVLSAVRHLAVRGSSVVAADHAGNLYRFETGPLERPTRRPRLYVQYGHADQEWFDRLRPHLEMAGIEVWRHDPADLSAKSWLSELEAFLRALTEKTDLVLVLVSRTFLSSEFAVGEVLPRLYKAAESGARITWIALDESGVGETELGRFQSIHREPPLALVEDPDRYLMEIAHKIRRLVLPPDGKQV